MERAAQVFTVDEHETDSSLVEKVWSTQSAPHSAFVAVAESHWQFVVTTHRGQTSVVVQGPNERAQVVPIPHDTEFFGIVVPLGTYMPAIPMSALIGTGTVLPDAGRGKVWLGGSRCEIPAPHNADVFVERLMNEGVLAQDRHVSRSLGSETSAVSPRTMQRRVLRATGMTQSVIRQISRAHAAVDALGQGLPPSDVAGRLGFADQPHLTRSLRRFVGQTPAEVLNTGGHWSASSPVRSDALAAS